MEPTVEINDGVQNIDMTSTDNEPKADATETNVEDSVTMTSAELQKKLQSEADKIRTQYSKKVKELEDKLKEVTPKQPTQEEFEIEKRLQFLEDKNNELAQKEKFLELQTTLSDMGIDKNVATYIKGDTDVSEFGKLIDKIVADKMVAKGFQANNHNPNPGITQDKWDKMSYSERVDLYNKNPDIYAKYTTKKK